MSAPTITALYLVKNEEEWLPMSVATIINDVDELVLIDNESTDGTWDIITQLKYDHPEKVVADKMAGDFDKCCEYANRNKSLKYVTSDWVMTLDADQLISDGWYKWARNAIADRKNDAVRFRYEHYVGSYEHIHKAFYEKQKNPELYPEVPLWQTVLWRMRKDLEFHPAMESDPRFKEFHHASPDLSMRNRRFYNCGSATCFHYGFSRNNMMHQSAYRIQRGDYGHDQVVKDKMIAELKASGNPFHFVSDGVVPVDYGREHVPSVIRDKFGRTYRLELYPDGRIKQRYSIKTGLPA